MSQVSTLRSYRGSGSGRVDDAPGVAPQRAIGISAFADSGAGSHETGPAATAVSR